VLVAGYSFLHVFLAKAHAIRTHKHEVNLFFGMAKLVLWEANEGLVLLKNKQVNQIIYGPEDGGGTKYIFPLLGEEVRIREAVTLKLTQFEDGKVLTRDSIQVFLKVAFWWRVSDLEKYYASVDKQVHMVSDTYRKDQIVDVLPADTASPKEGAAETWLLTIAESCIRKLVSQTSIASLISKSAMRYLHIPEKHRVLVGTSEEIPMGLPASSKSARSKVSPATDAGTPDVLADEVRAMLAPRVGEYGLEIDRVEVQEVRLPEGVQTAIDDLYEAMLLPARTEQESIAQRMRLQAVADVLGVEMAGLDEVLKNFKGAQYIGGNMMAPLMTRVAGASKGKVLGKKTEDSRHEIEGADAPVLCPSCGNAVQMGVAKCVHCGGAISSKRRPKR